jgi:glucose-1-phosphate thymidylyltransferase
LVEDISQVCGEPVDEIAFIIGDFGDQVEKELINVAEGLGAKGTVYHQEEALGTAHAILCAKESLKGNIVVAFADTLFKADFTLDTTTDGIIWVSQIDDPSAFGVVKLDDDNVITEFVEKPETFVSDLAIIGIYYFKNGEFLSNELQYLIDNDIKEKGEFQLTNALENMKQKGTKFKTGAVSEWLDCGNKNATVFSNQRVLEFEKDTNSVSDKATIENSIIIHPCHIAENAIIKNSVIGPHVSVGNNTVITNCIIKNSIIQNDSNLTVVTIADSMIGNHATYIGKDKDLSIGDYTEITE